MDKLVLIEIGNNTKITITLVITSINQQMHIRMPSTTLVFILGFTVCAVIVNRLPPYQGSPHTPVPSASLATYL